MINLTYLVMEQQGAPHKDDSSIPVKGLQWGPTRFLFGIASYCGRAEEGGEKWTLSERVVVLSFATWAAIFCAKGAKKIPRSSFCKIKKSTYIAINKAILDFVTL